MKPPPVSFQSQLHSGIDGIYVNLLNPMQPLNAAEVIASFFRSTWGDPTPIQYWSNAPKMALMFAQDAMSGKVLPNTLETIPVTFSIQGISRATTHQLVRSRVGAVFGQQGGRDNNWSDFNLRVPGTFAGVMSASKVEALQVLANSLYKDAIEGGVPFQDARYILPMGLETSLVVSYNLLSFKGLADRRLCNRMMWETNYVVRAMTDLVVQAFPFVGKNLRSGCEKRGVCGSVSPMFPPSDLTWKDHTTKYAQDNPTLREESQGTYDFPLEQNGCYIHFRDLDRNRLHVEAADPDVVLSLVNGENVLITNEEEVWEYV